MGIIRLCISSTEAFRDFESKTTRWKFMSLCSPWHISWHISYSIKVSNSVLDVSEFCSLCLAMVHLCFSSDCKLLQHHQGSQNDEWLDKSLSNRTIFVSPDKVFSVMKTFAKTFPSEVILQFFHQKRSTIQMTAFHKTDLSNYFCPKRSILICMKKTRTRKAFIWRSFSNWLEHYSESRFLSQNTFEKENGRRFLKTNFVTHFDQTVLAIPP